MKKSLCFLLIVILFFLSGCNNKSSENNEEKLIAELDFIDTKIFDLSNIPNDISLENYELISREIEISQKEDKSNSSETEGNSDSSKTGQSSDIVYSTEMRDINVLDNNLDGSTIDWQKMKTEIELINDAWSVVSIDLSNAKIADNDILGFYETLNQTIISIKNEDKNATLENISKLYSFIPNFMNDISTGDYHKTIKSTKNELLKAYTAVSLNNWEIVSNHLTNAENHFVKILKDKDEIANKEFKVNKIQILIQNLKNCSELKDAHLFLLHYKLLIEEINTM